MRRISKSPFFLIPALFAVCGSASAQVLNPARLTGQPTPPGRPDTFGTTSQSVLTISAFDLETFNSVMTWSGLGTQALRYLTTNGQFEAGVQLPSGALVEKIELEACDTTNSGEVAAALASQAVPAGTIAAHGLIETGTIAMPGCAVFPLTLATPLTIDNKDFTYIVEISNNTFDETTSIAAMRISTVSR